MDRPETLCYLKEESKQKRKKKKKKKNHKIASKNVFPRTKGSHQREQAWEKAPEGWIQNYRENWEPCKEGKCNNARL